MVFVRNETRSGNAAALERHASLTSRTFRWIGVCGMGTAVFVLSLATLAGFVFLAASLTSPIDFAQHAQNAATPDKSVQTAALHASGLDRDCKSGCAKRSQYIVQQAKSPRKASLADKHLDPATLARDAAKQRFERAQASLTRAKLAAALEKARTLASAQSASASLPLKDRFYPAANVASLPDPNGPAADRFGPRVPEVDRSSRLALALAGSGTLHLPYPVQTASLGSPTMPLLLRGSDEETTEIAELPDSGFGQMPDSVPLPARRPKVVSDPVAIAQATPAANEAAPAKPATTRRQAKTPPTQRGNQQQMLAYAAPDDGADSVGQAFKNLFSSPRAGNGVAVYDISAQTVTMPNGEVLEAHSGIGHMADDPRYVNQRMNGPTPPNTYKLVMRESRFYGVEAIRMLPLEPKKMHGRDGILAHSYLLRGRRAQSHGCVAFADYERFLKAFKQGKVKHMLVVPGRSKPSPRVAKNGRST